MGPAEYPLRDEPAHGGRPCMRDEETRWPRPRPALRVASATTPPVRPAARPAARGLKSLNKVSPHARGGTRAPLPAGGGERPVAAHRLPRAGRAHRGAHLRPADGPADARLRGAKRHAGVYPGLVSRGPAGRHDLPGPHVHRACRRQPLVAIPTTILLVESQTVRTMPLFST